MSDVEKNTRALGHCGTLLTQGAHPIDQTVVGNDGVGLMLPPDNEKIAFDHFADEIIEE